MLLLTPEWCKRIRDSKYNAFEAHLAVKTNFKGLVHSLYKNSPEALQAYQMCLERQDWRWYYTKKVLSLIKRRELKLAGCYHLPKSPIGN